MVRYLLNFLLIFLMLSSLSFAKVDDAKLKKEYGPYLTQVPFYLRHAFYKKYHKDWEKTYYFEREDFLKDYEINLTAEQAKEKAEAKAEANKEKERLFKKKEALRKEKDRLKAELAEQKSEKIASAAEQKVFNESVAAQRKKIQEMKEEMEQEKRNSQVIR